MTYCQILWREVKTTLQYGGILSAISIWVFLIGVFYNDYLGMFGLALLTLWPLQLIADAVWAYVQWQWQD